MPKTALITGIAGGLARRLGEQLHQRGYNVVGVDYRPQKVALGYPAEVYQANYNKTKIEDIFRRHRPTHVVHLGRVGNLKQDAEKRFDLNVIGSRKVMDLSARYEAQRLVVFSTFHIYGAHPHNHIPIFEDEPLRAGTEFSQLGDAIQLDNQGVAWMYQHREVPTVLLRPTNVVGPEIDNAMSNLLRAKRAPVMLGFNPMVQFIHQDDLVQALWRATDSVTTGIFNLAGVGVVPWAQALELAGVPRVPMPSTVAITYLKLAGLISAQLPSYLINFLMYPCVIGDDAFRKAFDWAPRVPMDEALRSTRMSVRPL